MSKIFCTTHFIYYDVGTVCRECRLEELHADQRALLDMERENAESQREMHEERLQALRDAEYRRFNPGDYRCNACQLTTLLEGASRCPICHADVSPTYWAIVRAARDRIAAAAIAKEKRSQKAREKASDRAVAIVKLGLRDTESAWDDAFQEARRKYEEQGAISRLLRLQPNPSRKRKYRFECTGFWNDTNGSWSGHQPALILGIVTLESKQRVGFKYYRFETPFEYVAVLRYLKTLEQWDMPELSNTLAHFERLLNQNWSVSENLTFDDDDDNRRDDSEGMEDIRENAIGGDARFQREYGRSFANSEPRDYENALKWYLKAAAQDDAVATRLIGFMYANGQAVSQDYGEAMRWYRKAASLGDAWAERHIGHFYHKGRGVIRDSKEALKWYRMASSHGDAMVRLDAQFNIDLLEGKFDQ